MEGRLADWIGSFTAANQDAASATVVLADGWRPSAELDEPCRERKVRVAASELIAPCLRCRSSRRRPPALPSASASADACGAQGPRRSGGSQADQPGDLRPPERRQDLFNLLADYEAMVVGRG